VAGCSAAPTQQWKKAGASPQQLAQDWKECEYEAQKAPQGTYGLVGGLIGNEMRQAKLHEGCMEVRGYGRTQ
jgi:hypothetical protein